MTQDEVSQAVRKFVTDHGLVQPVVCKRRNPQGWQVLFTLPTGEAPDAIRAALAYAQALGGPLHYGEARRFGRWEVQDYTAEGHIAPRIVATVVVVGVLQRIDPPKTADYAIAA